jgi:hypothetical protein
MRPLYIGQRKKQESFLRDVVCGNWRRCTPALAVVQRLVFSNFPDVGQPPSAGVQRLTKKIIPGFYLEILPE